MAPDKVEVPLLLTNPPPKKKKKNMLKRFNLTTNRRFMGIIRSQYWIGYVWIESGASSESPPPPPNTNSPHTNAHAHTKTPQKQIPLNMDGGGQHLDLQCNAGLFIPT